MQDAGRRLVAERLICHCHHWMLALDACVLNRRLWMPAVDAGIECRRWDAAEV